MTDRDMPPREIDLAALQRWLQAVIAHPAGVAAGVECDAAKAELRLASNDLETVILPGPAQSSAERLAVYSHAYFARLLDCLRELFPATASALGDDLFAQFGVDYLARHPSQSYTLARLGDEFAHYLGANRPPRDGDEPDWADLLADLGRFEQAIQEVFDGPGAEELPPLELSRLASLDANSFLSARLVANPSLRLLEFRFPLNDYFTALRRCETPTPTPPSPQPSWLALWRRDYVVRRLPLSRGEFVMLQTFLSGEPVERALEVGLADDRSATDTTQLNESFRVWSVAGFFVDVVVE